MTVVELEKMIESLTIKNGRNSMKATINTKETTIQSLKLELADVHKKNTQVNEKLNSA